VEQSTLNVIMIQIKDEKRDLRYYGQKDLAECAVQIASKLETAGNFELGNRYV
jgi:hypothetical protein